MKPGRVEMPWAGLAKGAVGLTALFAVVAVVVSSNRPRAVVVSVLMLPVVFAIYSIGYWLENRRRDAGQSTEPDR